GGGSVARRRLRLVRHLEKALGKAPATRRASGKLLPGGINLPRGPVRRGPDSGRNGGRTWVSVTSAETIGPGGAAGEICHSNDQQKSAPQRARPEYPDVGRLLQEALQHPGRLLVNLDALDGEVLCLEVIRFPGALAELDRVGDGFLVTHHQGGDEVLRREWRGQLVHAGFARELGQASNGEGVECAD